MKTTHAILMIVTLIFLNGCADKHCDLCFTPPESFTFELVGKETGENLFYNGTFNPENIKVIDLADNSDVEFTYVGEDNIDIINIYTIGWKTENVTYALKVGDETIFNLNVDAERVEEGCCSFTRFKEIKIEDSEYEKSESTGIYKILVD